MSPQTELDAEKMTTANGKAGIVWRIRQYIMALDYSAYDYTADRIGWLEREVMQLKDEVEGLRAKFVDVANFNGETNFVGPRQTVAISALDSHIGGRPLVRRKTEETLRCKGPALGLHVSEISPHEKE